MEKYPITIYSDHSETHFEISTATRLAGVSEAFIMQCERQELVTCRAMLHGKKGLCAADISRLKLVRHLHEDMGLDLEAVDFVLRYRQQIEILRNRLAEMEQLLREKEQ